VYHDQRQLAPLGHLLAPQLDTARQGPGPGPGPGPEPMYPAASGLSY
jgi:hypothetical protein